MSVDTICLLNQIAADFIAICQEIKNSHAFVIAIT